MFYCVEATLLTRNLSFSSHKGVISAELGRELNRAFEKRQVGDYEYTFVFDKGEAVELLESGKSFIKKIKQYLKKSGQSN